MDEVAAFYRVLLGPDHLQRWRAGQFNSFHGNNGEWWRVWKHQKSTNLSDYPRGVFTENAREAFLRFVVSGRERMTADEKRTTEEFDGVCAFETPGAAFEYGGRSKPPGPTWYVTFEGVLCGPVSEDEGVVAQVVTPFGAIMTPDDFKRIYSLDP
jgi:hypothetical protein